MRCRHLGLFTVVALAAVTAGPAAQSRPADWPQWRGPNRDGVIAAEPSTWPEKLNLKWKTAVGEGHASPILAGDSIYVFTRLNDRETVTSLDPSNGKLRWQQHYPAPYNVNPVAAQPAARVYTVYAQESKRKSWRNDR